LTINIQHPSLIFPFRSLFLVLIGVDFDLLSDKKEQLILIVVFIGRSTYEKKINKKQFYS